MAKFEVVFWAHDNWGKIEVEADYYMEIEDKEQYRFIKGPQLRGGTNVVLSIDSSEILYILQQPEDQKEPAQNPQITKFYNRFPQTLTA